jgi:hypothetical protein
VPMDDRAGEQVSDDEVERCLGKHHANQS